MSGPGDTINLPATYIGAQPPFGLDIIGGGFSYNAPPAEFIQHAEAVLAVVEWTNETLKKTEDKIKEKNKKDIAGIDSNVDQDIKKLGGLNSPMNIETSPQTVSKELGVVSNLKGAAQALADSKLQEAKLFFC